MDAVTVSEKFELVIPKSVRREFNIQPGDRMALFAKDGILHYVPVRPFAQTKGMTPGLNTHDIRD